MNYFLSQFAGLYIKGFAWSYHLEYKLIKKEAEAVV